MRVELKLGSLDGMGIQKAHQMLVDYKHGAERAIRDASARTKNYINKRAQELVPQEYDITREKFRKGGQVSVRTHTEPFGGVTAVTAFRGHLLGMIDFNPIPDQDVRQNWWVNIEVKPNKTIRVRPGVPVKGHLALNRPMQQLGNSFVATMPNKGINGHTAIWMRTGKRTSSGKEEIRELTGNSIAHMVGYGDVADRMVEGAREAFAARLDSNIERILSGKWKIEKWR